MRLTRAEKEAVLDVLNERVAGGSADLKDALGMQSEKEAERMMDRLENVITKIAKSLRSKDGTHE